MRVSVNVSIGMSLSVSPSENVGVSFFMSLIAESGWINDYEQCEYDYEWVRIWNASVSRTEIIIWKWMRGYEFDCKYDCNFLYEQECKYDLVCKFDS